jgi:hypothetical protein
VAGCSPLTVRGFATRQPATRRRRAKGAYIGRWSRHCQRFVRQKTSLHCGTRAAIFAAPLDRAIALERRRSWPVRGRTPHYGHIPPPSLALVSGVSQTGVATASSELFNPRRFRSLFLSLSAVRIDGAESPRALCHRLILAWFEAGRVGNAAPFRAAQAYAAGDGGKCRGRESWTKAGCAPPIAGP